MDKDLSDPDINDVFDAIAFSEDQVVDRAFQEGLKKGKLDGKTEGFHIGFHNGFQLGTEIGFYMGVVKTVTCNIDKLTLKNKEKVHLLLEKLATSLQTLPRNHNNYMDMMKGVESIRADYRKLTSLLHLNLSYPVTSSMSF